ncbi:MAG TPA: TraB/GumN family protein [Steroidobacteraceae bacterium]|nr:TraB/GumN family protein [Steroidobacteraceae bacterium]
MTRPDYRARCIRATACLWLAALPAAPAAAELTPVAAPIEEVLVTGRQPGPGLWKVTRVGDPNGHVLWVLGNYSPLPEKMTWRADEVESVIRASQQVLAPPSINASLGPLRGITLLPSLIGARNNPDGKRLQEVVPPDLYLRWLPLKARYLGEDGDVERWRPIFAANALYLAALKDRGLVPYAGVWPQVEKLARKADVPVHDPQLDLEVQKARAAIKQFKRMPLEDVECFARTLQRLETDMDLLRDRANAWAVGDVARLRRLVPVERATACIGVLLESSLMQERGYGDVIDRARFAWLHAAEEALQRNASTLAVISVDELLKPDGHFARLRQKGYLVEEP